MPNPHPLYEERLPCFRAYATNAYASELHKKREDPRYGITATDILMEAHDKIAGRKNEASSVTAASRISDKALQAMLVGGWQPAELQAAANDVGGDLYLDAGAELTERGNRHSPAPEAQPEQALPAGPRQREGRFRHNSSFAAHAAASSFLAGILDKQRMAGAGAQGVEHQGGGPRGVQWAEEPRPAPGGDSEDGAAARVQVSRAGPRFLRKAISEKASSAARWELMQPAGELAPEAPSPPTSPSSSTPGSLVLPGLSFDKARAGLRRMSSLARSSVSADVEALVSRTNSHLSAAAADAAVRQLQPHLPETPPHAALTEGRGSYAEGAGAVCPAAVFATTSVAAAGSSDGGNHSSRRGSLDERQYVPGGRSTLGGAVQGSRRSFERPSLECDAAAAGRPPSSQPLLSRTHSRRNSVAFVGTRSTDSLPTLAMASHPAHPAPASAATSPKEALGEAYGHAGWTQRLVVETGPGAGGAGPCVNSTALSPGGSAGQSAAASYASAAPVQYKRSSLDLSAFAPPQGGAPLAGSVRRCSVDLPSPTAAAAAASVASEREETRFKSVVHRLRKGTAVLPRSADALTLEADGLASARLARCDGDHPRSLSPAGARSYASSPRSPLSPAATPAASLRGLAKGDRDRRRLAGFEDHVSLA